MISGKSWTHSEVQAPASMAEHHLFWQRQNIRIVELEEEVRRSSLGNDPKHTGFERLRRGFPFRAGHGANNTPIELIRSAALETNINDGRIQQKARSDENRVGKVDPASIHSSTLVGSFNNRSSHFLLLPANSSATFTLAHFILCLARLAIATLIFIDCTYVARQDECTDSLSEAFPRSEARNVRPSLPTEAWKSRS